MVDEKNQQAMNGIKKSTICKVQRKPLKSRHQTLLVTKTFPDTPNVHTSYHLKKVSDFTPLPYEHLISHHPRRTPATRLTPNLRRRKKGSLKLTIMHTFRRPFLRFIQDK